MNPILLDFPVQIESERLIIRAPRFEDAFIMNEMVIESLEHLQPWMIWAQKAPSLEESSIQIRNATLDFLAKKDLQLLIIDKTTGKLIGSSGLHRINWNIRKFEIGYWVRSSETGKGYITEAVHAITHFAIDVLKANRIEIRCDEKNVKSANVAERCGFTKEGILRCDDYDSNNELRNTLIYSKVKGIEF